jgi:hypothetical protein
VAPLLERAFAAIRHDCPGAHAALARRLAGATVRLAVDDEVFDVDVHGGAPRVRAPEGPPSVSVRTSRAAVSDVLAGRRSLADAVWADDVEVTGSLGDLVDVLEALEAFVHGAVRSGEATRLLDEFQGERWRDG